MTNQIVIYQGKNGEIKFDADYNAETIWTTQAQIAEARNLINLGESK
ncbi:MAG: hypothetical protein LBU20_01105 [Candidatus Nomurabacteria bacterium]|jgi:hypothetical protein|nr:hypothetical protein [Candidatus Nomurabacteria bacterium]